MRILKIDELPWKQMKESAPGEPYRVFVRVDFNVPLENGTVMDDFRIRQALPTLQYLLEQKCIVILASHLGRPSAKDEKSKEKYTLLPVAERLAECLNHEVMFSEEVYGDGVKKLIQDGRPGKTVIMLENLRFDAREEENDSDFAELLFQNCDVYVNDAFGASHRAHASVDALPRGAKMKAMGFLLAKEWEALNQVLHHPRKPQMAILGGAKIADKIQVITHLMKQIQCLFVGGRMANTFLAAEGYSLGTSSIETESVTLARRILTDAKAQGVEIILPVDGKVADTLEAKECSVIEFSKGSDFQGSVFDIGPKTLELWKQKLKGARSVIWNGPMGVFEKELFAGGTLELVDFLVSVKETIQTVTGGGETVAAMAPRGALTSLFHVSTGGGAMLEFLEGKVLPGFEALKLREREVEALVGSQ